VIAIKKMATPFFSLKTLMSFFTALCAQTQTQKFFERVALQPFQKISCDLFDRKLL
jgi:hypothetical protein